jgi:Xaa-Pro aminopeptidase
MTVDRLPPMDVASRMIGARHAFEGAGIDALLVTHLPNVRYLSGFTGSAGLLLVLQGGALFVTDGRYGQQASEQLGAAGVDARVVTGSTQAAQREALAAAVAEQSVQRLGLEADGVTWAQQRTFATEWFPDAELVPTSSVIEDLRVVKEPGEVARVHAACAIADEALRTMLPVLRDRPTERDFALQLELAMRERGASGVSFDPIVAGGPNAAKPHARPSDRRIEANELVVIDFGCIVDGYCSDMTRTVSVGDPGPKARRIYDTVHEAQAAGCSEVAVGVECSAVDARCREVISKAGWGDAFVHGTGHGVGLEIHEAPRVASTAAGILERGNVVTVEPGVYLPGIGGVRIEDTLVVTPDGPIALTEFPKELVL